MATMVAILFFRNFNIHMKYLYLLLLASVLLLCCRKKHKTDDSTNSSNDFAYAVKCDSIISSPANSTYNFPFNIKLISGNISENKLTCSIQGMPGGVSVAPSTIVVGQLLSGLFTFSIGNLPVGDYPFKLNIKSEKYGEQVKLLVLRITALPDYAPLLAGSYDSCYDYCIDTGVKKYASQVATVADTPFLLKISNIRSYGSDFIVRAWVSKSVVIPVQTVSGKTIWGSGTYNQDARPKHGGHYVMAISDTIATGADTQFCTIHIEH